MNNSENVTDYELEGEIWKDISGYEGYYQVSNIGRVRSVDRYVDNRVSFRKGQIKKARVSRGYYVVKLKREGKGRQYLVHRLVAEAFISNPENKAEVNHIDGNKLNNHIENLEWVTSSENKQHAIRIGLLNPETCRENGRQSVKKVAIHVLCKDSGEVFLTEVDAASRLNISLSCLENTLNQEPHITDRGKGFHIEKISNEEYEELKKNQKSQEEYDKIYDEIKKKRTHAGKPMRIYCAEQDKYYDSISAAGKALNVNYTCIAYALNHSGVYKGITFRYVE